MDTIKVVCGIIFDQDKIFICRRRSGKFLAGFWEFPGGKIEDNESGQEALYRELQEELEMEVNIEDFIGQSDYDYGNFNIELFGYQCSLISYNGKLTDHDSFEWTEMNDLGEYKIAPADIPLIKLLEAKQAKDSKNPFKVNQ